MKVASPFVPLPILDVQHPILLVFDHSDPGVELAYECEPLIGGSRVRTAKRDTTEYWIPELTPVFAIDDGVVIYARRQADGHAVLIDHEDGWVSVYSRLAHLYVAPTAGQLRERRVFAGDILGYLGAPRGTPLTALRFELWRENDAGDYLPVDPIVPIRRWQYVEWRGARLVAAEDAADARQP